MSINLKKDYDLLGPEEIIKEGDLVYDGYFAMPIVKSSIGNTVEKDIEEIYSKHITFTNLEFYRLKPKPENNEPVSI